MAPDFTYLCPMPTRPVSIYTESTPNPASMKFVANFFLVEEGSVEYLSPEQARECPLAVELFKFSGISSVFITANFITVTKSTDIDWYEINPILREFIHNYLQSGQPVFTGAKIKASEPSIPTQTSNSLEEKIIETLDEYVRPAVEQDGGAIHIKSFDEGIVTLVLKGACSGCPSSSVTLKNGIENLLKQLIPEVKEVVAEEDSLSR